VAVAAVLILERRIVPGRERQSDEEEQSEGGLDSHRLRGRLSFGSSQAARVVGTAEAEAPKPGQGPVPVPERGARELGQGVECTTSDDTEVIFFRASRVDLHPARVWCVPIRDPLRDVAVHVMEAPGVG
jgi:hypothetical protein